MTLPSHLDHGPLSRPAAPPAGGSAVAFKPSVDEDSGRTRAPAPAEGLSRAQRVSSEKKDAILRSLYGERTNLNRKKRLDGLTAEETAYLADLNKYIDTWEEPEPLPAVADVWAQLDRLAGSLLSIRAGIEAKKT